MQAVFAGVRPGVRDVAKKKVYVGTRSEPGPIHVLRRGQLGKEGELVTAKAVHLRITFLDQVLQQAADGHDQQVAGAVAEVVVDVLEMVHVEQQH